MIASFGPYFTGFDYLANGCIDEGTAVMEKLLAGWKEQGITTMITLTGQSQYMFTVLLPYLGLETDIEFISILDLAERFDAENAYIYGGSYLTRYVRKDGALNNLLVNTEEEHLLSAPEFLPELCADKRRNVVGIWTPPLCAEYNTLAHSTDSEKAADQKALEEQIYADSLAAIKEASFGTLLVCDPFAYKALQEHGYPKGKMVYYLDVIR